MRARVRAMVFMAITVAAGPASPVDAQRRPPAPLPPQYLSALDSYRAGDLTVAFRRLTQLEPETISDVARQLMMPAAAAAASWPGLMTAAVLLQTEAFFVRAEAGSVRNDDAYIQSSHALVRRLLQLIERGEPGFGEVQRTFVRDWYLLLVAFQHGRAEIGWSRAYLGELRALFPKDASVALALASDHETLSELTTGVLTHVDSAGRFRKQSRINPDEEFAQAMRFMQEAAAAAPRFVEPRLRLGRLLYRKGDLDGAARELDTARQLSQQDIVTYLVLLFRGMVEAARGEYARADALYTEALRLMPAAQAAAIAKSEAAYLSGRTAEAAATIQSMLRQKTRDDPWWLYTQGEAWHFEARLAEIRKYVQQ